MWTEAEVAKLVTWVMGLALAGGIFIGYMVRCMVEINRKQKGH